MALFCTTSGDIGIRFQCARDRMHRPFVKYSDRVIRLACSSSFRFLAALACGAAPKVCESPVTRDHDRNACSGLYGIHISTFDGLSSPDSALLLPFP
jgi:hypothetical protein